MGDQAKQRMLQRLEELDEHINDTARALKLGPVSLMILASIWAQKQRVTLNEVLVYIYKGNGDIVDTAQAFMAMQTFKKEPPFLHEVGKKDRKGRRPSACFTITEQGKMALQETEQHLRRLLEFIELARADAEAPLVAVEEQQVDNQIPTKTPRR